MRKGARKKSEPKVIGTGDAANVCGVRQSNWHQLKGLPEPYDRIGATTLYREEEVIEFAKSRNGVVVPT